MATYLGNQLISGKNRPDGSTIDYNSSGRLQAAGALNRNSGGSPVKFWTGTKEEYDAIVTKDPATLYSVTDDTIRGDAGTRRLGEIVVSTLPIQDAWLHLLDGSLLNGNGSYKGFVDYVKGLYNSGSYSDLFTVEADWQTSVTTYGVCGKFVYDSVNNTVRLPKITGIVEGTTDLTALGDLVEAGLPNITGKYGAIGSPGQMTPSGAATWEINTGSGYYPTVSNNGYFEPGIDASLSNSIYGNSSTVQPQSVKALYYIVVATATKSEIQVDIDEIATDLNGKVDVDLVNLNATGKNNLVTLAHELDWTNYITVSTTNSDTDASYSPTADGVIYVRSVATGGSASKNMKAYIGRGENTDIWIYENISGTAGGMLTTPLIPVMKGETIYYRAYGTGGTGTNAVLVVFIPFKKS